MSRTEPLTLFMRCVRSIIYKAAAAYSDIVATANTAIGLASIIGDENLLKL